MGTNSLYTSVVDITQDYLGPAAGRFIDRQIANHIGKKPENLEPEDMKKLNEWLRVAISVLTDDQDMIDEYIKRLSVLIRSGPRRRRE